MSALWPNWSAAFDPKLTSHNRRSHFQMAATLTVPGRIPKIGVPRSLGSALLGRVSYSTTIVLR